MAKPRSLNISLLPMQQVIYQDKSRYKVLSCGRRFGKSRLTAYELLLHAVNLPDEVSWTIAPTYPQTMLLWREIKRATPKWLSSEVRIADRCIILQNGHEIWAKSGDNPDNLRGEGLTMVALDEVASMKPEVFTEAIQPALADKKGRAMFIGTPKGKNWFFDLFQRGFDPEYRELGWSSHHYTSYDNPLIDPTELDSLRKSMSEIMFRQEILAEFVDLGGLVFRMFTEQLADTFAAFEESGMYIAGLDLAKYQDFTVLTIINKVTGYVVYMDRFNKIDWEYQIQRVKGKLIEYGNPPCIVDSTGAGDPIFERLVREGINARPLVLSYKSKPQIIENLALLLEQRKVWLPNIPPVVNEFSSYEYIVSDSGNYKFGAPKGYHDDIVISVALAAWGMRRVSDVIGLISGLEKEGTGYEDDFRVSYDNMPRVASWNTL